MTDLGTLGGTYSTASRINNAGQIIGRSTTADDAQLNGFIYSGGVMSDLGTLGGVSSTPMRSIMSAKSLDGPSKRMGRPRLPCGKAER